MIFISYSRRQLYFAESIAIHLQMEDLNIWFDLQQLQAGTIWSDGLKKGIDKAETLVLIVSEASLASSYVTDEWKGVAAKGKQVVLVIYEQVELPKELQGLPTFDFRKGFDNKIKPLISYLKGDSTLDHYDKIYKPNRLKISTKMPGNILAILVAQFSPLILLTIILGISVYFDHKNPIALRGGGFLS